MAQVIKDITKITGYDDYVKDYEETANEEMRSQADSKLQSICDLIEGNERFAVFLDVEQTREREAVKFNFYTSLEDGEAVTEYVGMS